MAVEEVASTMGPGPPTDGLAAAAAADAVASHAEAAMAEGAASASQAGAVELVAHLIQQQAAEPSRRVLVVGDENLLFSAGLQEAYPDIEFTAATVLSRQNLEAYNFDPLPQVLRGRVRHMVDPCRIGKHFQQHAYDDILLFLPGLGFMVPRELGTADRPLFAYRTHLFAFHVIRHSKLVLKGEGHLHLVWPDENRFMTSPCGAAGIEMSQLIGFCGCKPCEAHFEMEKIKTDHFWPFLFGDVPAELPEWLTGTRFHTFTLDKSPIAIPLSVALFLHPDVGFVTIKDATTDPSPPPAASTSLRIALLHEASARKGRLKEIYGPKEKADDKVDAFGLIPEPAEEDSMLSLPMEIFMISFDDLPHLSMLLKFLVCEEQPQTSVASLDVLDPRLPTRIARPPPPKPPSPLLAMVNSMLPGMKKRQRTVQEEWGGMKFHCSLTKICTMTADKMRMHMAGDLYKRLAADTPSWEESAEKKELILDLEEEEAEEQQKRARMGPSHDRPQDGGKKGGKGKGKGGGKKGGKGK